LHIVSSKITHIPRGFGARTAEERGADSDQLNRLAGWRSGAKNAYYTTDLPRQPMRVLAGWPSQGGGYFLPRAIRDPPLQLQKQFFSFADEQIDSVTDIAGKYFLLLLMQLRIILLQDAPLLRALHPHHPIWNHELFSRDDFCEFATQVIDGIDNDVNPSLTTLQQVAPEITATMETNTNHIITQLSTFQTNFMQVKENQQQLSQSFSGFAEDILRKWHESEQETENLRSVVRNTARLFNSPQIQSLQQSFMSFANSGSHVDTSRSTSTSALSSSSSSLPPTSTSFNTPLQSSNAVLQTSSSSVANDLPTTYQLQRSFTTVVEVWNEYKHGYNGGPSICQMNEVYQAKWRKTDKERKYYSNRNIFYSFIEAHIEEGRSGREVAEALDLLKIGEDLTLDRLCKLLNQERHNIVWEDGSFIRCT